MSSRPSLRRTCVLALGLVATVSFVTAAPCDLYASGDVSSLISKSIIYNFGQAREFSYSLNLSRTQSRPDPEFVLIIVLTWRFRQTPCIAAHSTTRALYSAFSGSLYVGAGEDLMIFFFLSQSLILLLNHAIWKMLTLRFIV